MWWFERPSVSRHHERRFAPFERHSHRYTSSTARAGHSNQENRLYRRPANIPPAVGKPRRRRAEPDCLRELRSLSVAGLRPAASETFGLAPFTARRMSLERLIHSVISKRNMLSTGSLTLFNPLIRLALRLFRIFSQNFQYKKGLRRALLSRSGPNTSTSKKKLDLANFPDSFLSSVKPTGISRERVPGRC